MRLTAVCMPVPEGYIGFVEELPGANTQGATQDEAREKSKEAVPLVRDANRELAAYRRSAESSRGRSFSDEAMSLFLSKKSYGSSSDAPLRQSDQSLYVGRFVSNRHDFTEHR